MSRSCLKQLQTNHGSILLDCQIPAPVRVSESQLFGQPLVDYKPKHKAARAFERLAKSNRKGADPMNKLDQQFKTSRAKIARTSLTATKPNGLKPSPQS